MLIIGLVPNNKNILYHTLGYDSDFKYVVRQTCEKLTTSEDRFL